ARALCPTLRGRPPEAELTAASSPAGMRPTQSCASALDATAEQPRTSKAMGPFIYGELPWGARTGPTQVHGDFRYLQATIPAPVTFSSNAWFPLGSIAGMSCCCEATVSPLAFTNSNVTAVGGLGLVLRFVMTPANFAPCSSGVNVPTVTSVVMESAMVR